MPAIRALALIAVAATAAHSAHAQQAPLILKAGTPITIANQYDFVPGEAHVGDSVDFTTSYPVRVGKTAVIPKGTMLHGHVTALKPKVEITLDPVQVSGATVAFSGHPFETKGAPHDVSDLTPPEFAWHGQFTTRGKLELAGLIVVASPIIVVAVAVVVVVAAVALPIYGIYYLAHPHDHHRRKSAHTLSSVTLSSDTTFEVANVAGPKPYSGLPILYLVDRYRTNDEQLLCNGQPFHAKAFDKQLTLRVPAQTYTFSPAESGQTSAIIDAKPDGCYLIYRDKAGLHAEDLAERPELLEQGVLQNADKSDKFFFDYTTVPANQQSALDEQRKAGGCGLSPTLRARPPRPLPAPTP